MKGKTFLNLDFKNGHESGVLIQLLEKQGNNKVIKPT